VGDFVQRVFERLDDKKTLVIGAGEMASETLKYLREQGARDIVVVNRNPQRARDLAQTWSGRAVTWDHLLEMVAAADLIISATCATEPIITSGQFREVERRRAGRMLFLLDLAVPRNVEPAVGDRPGVYLYSVDDLREVCEQNRRRRESELPRAMAIIDQEAARFLGDIHHRAVGPVVQRLRRSWQEVQDQELERLYHKLPQLDGHARHEIEQSLSRLVNKLLHAPLTTLREESGGAVAASLLDSLRRLFQLQD
jgi:glutamyl-tRNA reductase